MDSYKRAQGKHGLENGALLLIQVHAKLVSRSRRVIQKDRLSRHPGQNTGLPPVFVDLKLGMSEYNIDPGAVQTSAGRNEVYRLPVRTLIPEHRLL